MSNANWIQNLLTLLLLVLCSEASYYHDSDETPDLHNQAYIFVPDNVFLDLPNSIEIRSKTPLTKLTISTSTQNLKTDPGSTEIDLKDPNETDPFFTYRVEYRLPFATDNSEVLRLTLNYEYCPRSTNNTEQSYAKQRKLFDRGGSNVKCERPRNVTRTFSVSSVRRQVIIMGETHKPIYRPGEELRFRFLALNSQMLQGTKDEALIWPKFKLDKSDFFNRLLVKTPDLELERRSKAPFFDEIYIEDPSGRRVQEWKKIMPRQALNLSYTLLPDAKQGEWKIIAQVLESRENLIVTVKHYSLPRFLARVELPQTLGFSEDTLRFNVCASYTNGPSMRGPFVAQICVCSKGKLEMQIRQKELFSTNVCPSGYGRGAVLRNCFEKTGFLSGSAGDNGCSINTISLKKHLIQARKYPYWDDSIGVFANIEEEGTDSRVFASGIVGMARYEENTLQMQVSEVYRMGLPIHGHVVFKTGDSKMNVSDQNILLTVVKMVNPCENMGWWSGDHSGRSNPNIYRAMLSTNDKGFANFSIPSMGTTEKLKITAQLVENSTNAVSKSTSDIMFKYMPTIYPPYQRPSRQRGISVSKILTYWTTFSDLSLDVMAVKASCPGEMLLDVVANKPLSGRRVYLEYRSRGRPKKVASSLEQAETGFTCVNQDNENGHYTCNPGVSEGVVGEITCLKGWTGENCLTPICGTGECGKGGLCVLPGQCLCKDGWRGDSCEVCTPREGCKHGICEQGNDCVCAPGYQGYLCDRTVIRYEDLEETSSTTEPKSFTTEPPKSFVKSQSIRRTIFKHSVKFPMDGTYGPVFRGVLYVYQSVLKRNSQYDEIVSDFVRIDSLPLCTNQLIAQTSTQDEMGIHFNRHNVVPGGKLQLDLRFPFSNVTSLSTSSELDNVCLIKFTDASLRNFETDLTKPIDLSSYIIQLKNFPGYYKEHGIMNTVSSFAAAGISLKHVSPFADELTARIVCPMYALPQNSFDTYLFGATGARSSLDRVDSGNILKPRLRDYFPEVWLFDHVELQLNKKSFTKAYTSEFTAPDTITSWDFNAVCFSSDQGLWMPLKKPSVTVSLPFYVEFTTPIQAKRREILHLPVSVFMLPHENKSIGDCYEVSVTTSVAANDWLTVGVTEFTTCLCAGDPKVTFNLALKPRRIGLHNVTAEAIAKLDSPMCNKHYAGSMKNQGKTVTIADAVRRAIRVVPEGIDAASTVGGVMCLNNGQNEMISTMKVNLPKAIVSGSLRSYVSVSGNVLGKALSNLDRLIHLPTGCGEQNMVKVAPNVYVLKYLVSSSTFNTSLDLANKVLRFIASGYENQLNYKHDNGSFSVFGPKGSKHGSVWLTAYVFSVFAEAENIFSQLRVVDPSVHVSFHSFETLSSAFDFLKNMQRADGCYDSHGYNYHPLIYAKWDKMAQQKQEVLLTSYVLSALLNAPTTIKESKGLNFTRTVQKAKLCIFNNLEGMQMENLTTVLLAKVLFALSRIDDAKSMSYVKGISDVIMKRSKREISLGEEWIWWTEDSKNSAMNVEVTSYIYLAMRNLQPNNNMMPIIRWLSRQQKDQGGFYSTQDTVLALQALSDAALNLKIAGTALNGQANISVNIGSLNTTVSAVVNQSNSDISQLFALGYHNHEPEMHINVRLASLQPTCVAVHTSFLYNTPLDDAPPRDAFFSLEVSSKQGPENMPSCTQATTTVCASLTEMAAQRRIVDTGMIVISLEIPSGWSMSAAELADVAKSSYLERVELTNQEQKVVAYFTAFSQAEVDLLGGDLLKLHRCVSLPLQQRMHVESQEAAAVTVLDYANPHVTSETSFNLNACKPYWIEEDFKEEVTETTVLPQLVASTPTPSKCPDCEKLSTNQIINKLTEALCSFSGSFNLFKRNSSSEQGHVYSGSIYELTYSTKIASWQTNISLSNACRCQKLDVTDVIAIFSSDRNVYPGDAEVALAGRQVLALEDIEEAAAMFIKQQTVKKPQDGQEFWRWCQRSEGLRLLLRKLSIV